MQMYFIHLDNQIVTKFHHAIYSYPQHWWQPKWGAWVITRNIAALGQTATKVIDKHDTLCGKWQATW
jgi:hypothetical protein